MLNLNSATLSELKQYAADKNIVIEGDRRRKHSYIAAIEVFHASIDEVEAAVPLVNNVDAFLDSEDNLSTGKTSHGAEETSAPVSSETENPHYPPKRGINPLVGLPTLSPEARDKSPCPPKRGINPHSGINGITHYPLTSFAPILMLLSQIIVYALGTTVVLVVGTFWIAQKAIAATIDLAKASKRDSLFHSQVKELMATT